MRRTFLRVRRITVANEYDALHRRIQRTYDDPGLGSPLMGSTATTTDHFYTASWQIIEDRIGDDVTMQFVWGAMYVNGLVLRDRDTDVDGEVDERHYFQHDANFNVTALIEDDGDVVERVVYDAYGTPTFLDDAWANAANFSSVDNAYLYQGGRRDPTTGFVNFQMRDLSTGLGRWIQQDPAGYVDGMNLYQFVVSNPVNRLDPSGLRGIGPDDTPTSAGSNSDGRPVGSYYTPPSNFYPGHGTGYFLPDGGFHPTAPPPTTPPAGSFEDCAAACAAEILGLDTLLGGAAVVGGLPLVPKPFQTPGSSAGTSLVGKLIPPGSPSGHRLWAPTLKHGLAVTTKPGRFVCRWIPFVGTALLIKDGIDFAECMMRCQEYGPDNMSAAKP